MGKNIKNKRIKEMLNKIYSYKDHFPNISFMFGIPLGQGRYYICSKFSSLPKTTKIDFYIDSTTGNHNISNVKIPSQYNNVLTFSDSIPLCRTTKELGKLDWIDDFPYATNNMTPKSFSYNKKYLKKYKNKNTTFLFHNCQYIFSIPEINSFFCYEWGFVIYSSINICLFAIKEKHLENYMNKLLKEYDNYFEEDIHSEEKHDNNKNTIENLMFNFKNIDFSNAVYNWHINEENNNLDEDDIFNYEISKNFDKKPDMEMLSLGEFQRDLIL